MTAAACGSSSPSSSVACASLSCSSVILRTIGREQLEQLAHCTVGAVALVCDGCPGSVGRAAQRGEDVGELVGPTVVQAELLRGDVRVERVDPEAERQVALELGRRPRQDEVTAILGTTAQVREQTRLADAGLALHGGADRLPARQRVERVVELPEL